MGSTNDETVFLFRRPFLYSLGTACYDLSSFDDPKDRVHPLRDNCWAATLTLPRANLLP